MLAVVVICQFVVCSLWNCECWIIACVQSWNDIKDLLFLYTSTCISILSHSANINIPWLQFWWKMGNQFKVYMINVFKDIPNCLLFETMFILPVLYFKHNVNCCYFVVEMLQLFWKSKNHCLFIHSIEDCCVLWGSVVKWNCFLMLLLDIWVLKFCVLCSLPCHKPAYHYNRVVHVYMHVHGCCSYTALALIHKHVRQAVASSVVIHLLLRLVFGQQHSHGTESTAKQLWENISP